MINGGKMLTSGTKRIEEPICYIYSFGILSSRFNLSFIEHDLDVIKKSETHSKTFN